MKYQRKHRLPAGHSITIEIERNKKFKPFGPLGRINALGKHNLTNEHLRLNIGRRKSKKPVTLANRA